MSHGVECASRRDAEIGPSGARKDVDWLSWLSYDVIIIDWDDQTKEGNGKEG
jgi:hypothetical protein